MKGMAYIIFFAFLALGLFGLFYVVFDHVYDTQIYSWGQSNIIDGNQTQFQTYYKIAWDAAPIVVVFAFFMFLLVWSQKRGSDEYV